METAILLLGSNMGAKKENLQQACSALMDLGRFTKVSSIYITAAWGKEDQNSFLNQVIKMETLYNPSQLLERILEIEIRLGRERKEKWGERIIDIDILYMGNLIIDSKNLKIPHPEIQNRRFTLVPLIEIDQDFKHPVLQLTQLELLEMCEDPLLVEKYEEPEL